MKRFLFLLGLLALIAVPPSSTAAGLIVVESGPDVIHHPPPPRPPHPPVPPPRPIPPPAPRPVSFAPLEVASHRVDVRVNDQVAVTTIDQEFYNPNPRQMEGTFLFPLPKGAQLRKFTMEIGGKPVEAELLSADKARKIYEDIVRKAKDPALLEYAGRDLLRARIFPIEAHGRKRVSLSYTEVLQSDFDMVGYVYPLNTAKYSARPVKDFSLRLELETGRPLKTIYSPTHSVEIRRDGERRATIGFEAKELRADLDFQLHFGTGRDDIGLSLMTHRAGDGEGYFLLLASPGANVREEKIVAKDIAFVLDTSGSMSGGKLEQAKKALKFCVDNLNADDRFQVVRFSTDVEHLFQGLASATRPNRDKALEFIQNLRATGGTAIHDALQQALALRGETSERPFVIIFLTDGLPTVGVTKEEEIVALAGGGKLKETRVFCFGIGTDVNTHLLDKITEKTRAFSQYVLPNEDIEVKVSNFYTRIKEPVLANPSLRFGDRVRAGKMYPSPLPDLFKGQQLVLVGRYSGHGPALVELSGTVNGAPRKFTHEAVFPESASDNEFIPRLWATRRVGHLLDQIRLHGENAELRDEVAELARKYGIVTPYTAYLILEDEQRRNVPLTAQTLPQVQADNEVRLLAREAYVRQNADKSGDAAVRGARSGLALKAMPLPHEALSRSQAESVEALAAIGGPSPAAGRVQATVRLREYTQQSRQAGGRTFYQNGSQWTDSEIQKLPEAKRVRMQFASKEYFDFLARNPNAGPWLALGQNVQFVWDGVVYEVHE